MKKEPKKIKYLLWDTTVDPSAKVLCKNLKMLKGWTLDNVELKQFDGRIGVYVIISFFK